jgi:N-acetylneuraminic acid mutarotase
VALVNNNGFLYALGGFAGDARGGWRMRANGWRLRAVDALWEEMRPMPHPFAETACASLSGFIHVAGGRAPAGSQNLQWSDHIDTDEHWLYDAAADHWHSQAPLPTPRNSAAAAVVNGVLYVIGGRTVSDGNTPVVEVYDPGSDRWEQARPMPKAQAGLAASVLGGKIYVFGGEYFNAGGGVFPDAWEYDPRTDEWRAVAAMPRPRHGLGAVTLDNAIYVLGGAARAGAEATSAALDRFEI